MKFGLGASTERNGIPHIETVLPAAAIPGGEVEIRGSGFATRTNLRPVVRFGDALATLALASSRRIVARVPEGANEGVVRVATPEHESQPFSVSVGMQIADNLHPVASPAVDAEGNIFVTFSGERGQRVPVSLYKITANFNVKPFVTSLMNPSGLALDRGGNLFVSCRNDGTIHRVSPVTIFTWAIAAAPSLKLVPAAKFLFLQRLNHRSPRITWRFIQAASFMLPAPLLRVLTVFTAFPRAATSPHFSAASDARKVWPSIAKEIFLLPHRWAAAAVSFA
jgi:hypothetical protein